MFLMVSKLNDYNKISRSEKEFNDNSFNFIELSTKFSSIKEQFWNTSLFWLLFSSFNFNYSFNYTKRIFK